MTPLVSFLSLVTVDVKEELYFYSSFESTDDRSDVRVLVPFRALQGFCEHFSDSGSPRTGRKGVGTLTADEFTTSGPWSRRSGNRTMLVPFFLYMSSFPYVGKVLCGNRSGFGRYVRSIRVLNSRSTDFHS